MAPVWRLKMYASIALAVLQRQGHVAAVVKRLFERLAQVFFAGQFGDPAFELLVLGAGSDFQRFDLLDGVLQRLRRSCVGLLKGACGVLNLHQRRRAMRRRLIEKLERVLVLVACRTCRGPCPRSRFSDRSRR